MEQKIKLGIIGIGNMGTGHLRSIWDGKCPELTVTALADSNPSRLEWARTACRELGAPHITCFDDPVAMMDSGLIDAVLIAAPHFDHAHFAVEAMKRSLHVMCEKPAGVYTLQVRQMMEESARHPELAFGMMFNQRTNHTYRKVKELVDCGKYGQIRRVSWIITNWYRSQVYYDSGDWRATWSGEGGGVLLNQCPHQLDLWQWICGMPVKVHTHMHFGKWHDIEVEDDVTTYVEYANGATGLFIASTGDAVGTNRLEIQMDGCRILCDGEALELLEYEMPEPEFSRKAPHPFASIPYRKVAVETDGENLQHIGVLNAWAGHILRGTPMVARGEEGLQGLMLSNAMHLSAFLGQEVTLPIDEQLYYEELSRRMASSRRKAPAQAVLADTSGSYSGTK